MRRIWHEPFPAPESQAGQATGQRQSLARALLFLAIGALCLAALVAIGILPLGSFGETEGKVLLTVVGIAGYSMLGLAATTAIGRDPAWLGPAGLAISAVAFGLFVALIWAAPEQSLLGRLMGTFLVLAVALVHAALLLLLTGRVGEGPLCTVRRATLVASSVLAGMIIGPLLFDWEPSGAYFRVLGAAAVLAVLGTLLVPILRKLAAGTPRGWTAGADGGDGAACARLEMRYKGQIFAIETVEHGHPGQGFDVRAWEVTRDDREPVVGLADPGLHEDAHTALASAVLQITRAIDGTSEATGFSGKREPCAKSAPRPVS